MKGELFNNICHKRECLILLLRREDDAIGDVSDDRISTGSLTQYEFQRGELARSEKLDGQLAAGRFVTQYDLNLRLLIQVVVTYGYKGI